MTATTTRVATHEVRYFIDCDNSSAPHSSLDSAYRTAVQYGAGAVIIVVTDDGSVMGSREYLHLGRDYTLTKLINA